MNFESPNQVSQFIRSGSLKKVICWLKKHRYEKLGEETWESPWVIFRCKRCGASHPSLML